MASPRGATAPKKLPHCHKHPRIYRKVIQDDTMSIIGDLKICDLKNLFQFHIDAALQFM